MTQFAENIYEDIVFTRFFGSLPAVTFTFDLWSHKLISTSTNPNTSATKLGEIPFIGLWNCEIWCSQGFRVIACCDLDVWDFDLISMSQTLVHTSPSFGEVSSNIYEDIVFTLFCGSLHAMTLTFDLWSQKLIGTRNPNTYVTKIGRNSLHWCDMVLTRFPGHCLLWPWPLYFWHQKLISTSTNPKLGEIHFIGFRDMVFTRFSGRTDSRTHSHTDRPECSMPPAPFLPCDCM